MPAPGDHLFGTDGIRGRWQEPPLDPDSLVRLGAALAEVMGPGRFLVGEDTRESSPLIREHLLAGMTRRQEAGLCGRIPTPGLAWAVRSRECDWGIMITASHNPWMDNGIKLLDSSGSKADDRVEARLESIFRSAALRPGEGARRFTVSAAGEYGAALTEWAAGLDGGGARLVVDAANGAAAAIAPDLFSRMGYRVERIGCAPDGRNINRGCGATHLENLQAAVPAAEAALGVALDGDGDRALFVDSRGEVLTGDHVLFALAENPGGRVISPVVGTVMSNLGLERALERLGAVFHRAPVGDRHVARLMKETGAQLGGEPSGHTIYAPLQPTGDGLLTALLLLRALGRDPGEAGRSLRRRMDWFAQETRSVPVERRRDPDRWPELQRLLSRIREREGTAVRILVRNSGTEPKVRLMVEAEDPRRVGPILDELESLVREHSGAGNDISSPALDPGEPER